MKELKTVVGIECNIFIIMLVLYILFSIGTCTYTDISEKGIKNIATDLWEGKQDTTNTAVHRQYR